ncbi:MAG: ArsB/NhaD family transporter [Gordonia sp. (in: high G+C Gram-positive bacteria)]
MLASSVLDAQRPVGTAISVGFLLAVVAASILPITLGGIRIRPVLVAVPGAVVLIVLGVIEWSATLDELTFLGPVIGFLAAMFVIADVCARTGVFSWVGARMAVSSGGSPTRLLSLVFVVAAVTTAVLSIDTTIVLLTPVAVGTARLIGARVAPVGAASAHLANSASTLLPVSNLTNLLAFSATGLGFLGFAGLMAAPWVVAIAVEYAIFRWFFNADLAAPRQAESDHQSADAAPARPTVTLVMLGLLLTAFVIAGPLGVPLWAVAVSGAVIMVAPLTRRYPIATAARTGRALNVGFLAFVAALGVLVLGVRVGPVGGAITALLPTGESLPALLAAAAIAAVAANLLNNLPATLLLIPLVAHSPGLALAVLLGVNIGPNLSYFGSLANLLWHDVMRRHGTVPPTRRSLLLGAVSVPPTLVAAVIALWVALQF